MIAIDTKLKENIEFLNGHGIYYPHQVDLNDSIPESIDIFRTKTQKLTIQHRGTLIHSQYDPDREARRFIAAQQIQVGDNVLIFGLGLGYHIRDLYEAVGQAGKVIIFEPNMDIMRSAMILCDFQDIFGNNNVRIIFGEEEAELAGALVSFVDNEFSSVPQERQKVVLHMPSFQCMPPEFDKLRSIFDLLLVERSAQEVFGDLQQLNVISNLDILLSSPSLEAVREKVAGKAVLFVNAGPSLDDALSELKEISKNLYLFASDTAFSLLKREGISVDAVFSVDPQRKTSKNILSVEPTETILIGLPTMDSVSLNQYRGERICVLQRGNSVTSQFDHLLKDKSFTSAGGSVSCIGLDIIMSLGVSDVILVGCDYAFSQGKMYSCFIADEKKWYVGSTRFRTLEMMHHDAILGEKTMPLKGQYGNALLTHQTLYLYLKEVESIIEKNPNTCVYSYRSSGAKIKGAQVLSSREQIEHIDELYKKERIRIDREEVPQSLRREIATVLKEKIEV